MNEETTWQADAIDNLSQIFENDPDARAFVLSGSLAGEKSSADVWSDVDAKIILADHAIERYYLSTGWLFPFGQLIGVERHETQLTKTLRVCLEGFKRFDLTFVAESVLEQPSLGNDTFFSRPYVVAWSRLPNVETRIDSISFPTEYREISRKELERIADEFWFKASIAIAKVVRNDLLMGLHLALDLARDILLLQMVRRDREKRTTVHWLGGWGNELVARFSWNREEGAGEEILRFVKLSGEIFDEVASDFLPDYEQRGPLLYPTIELAKQACAERIRSGQQ